MADPDVNCHGLPSGSHKIVSAEDDLRMLVEEALLSNGLQLSDSEEDTPSLNSPHSNDLPSVTPITDSQDDDDRIRTEEDALASEFRLSDESDGGVGPSSLDKVNALTAIQVSPDSSKRLPVDKYFAVAVEVQKNHQIEDGLQGHCALEPQDVVTAPEQHTSLRQEHGVFAAQIPPSLNDLSADEEDFLAEMMRNLGNQRVNELPLFDDHKPSTKTKPAEGANEANLPVANHGDGIVGDFNKLAQQNRDKHDPTLDGLNFIGADEYRLNLAKQLMAGKDGEPSRGSDGFFASRGGYTRKGGGSPLRGGRGGGHIGSSRLRYDLGFGRRLSFDASGNYPAPPPPTDPKLADALALARSLKFNPADGKSSRGRPSSLHSSVGRSAGSIRATFAAAKTKAPSPKKTTKRSRQASFNKDMSASLVVKRTVVKTTFNDWLSNASSTLAAKSASRPPSAVAAARPNSAPRLSETTRKSSAETTTRPSHETHSVVQTAYIPSLPSRQAAQDYEDEYGPDNIYDALPLPPAQLISLSPVRSAASEGALLDLRELLDEDNLNWISMPVFQPGLSSEAATNNQPATGVETADDGTNSTLLMDFGFTPRVGGQSSATASYRRHGNISGSTIPLSLMDQCFDMDKELLGGSGTGEAAFVFVESIAVVTAARIDGCIRYSRDELMSMRHDTSPIPLVSSVDNIPVNFHSWSLCLRSQSRASSVVPPKPPKPQADVATADLIELPVAKISGLGGLADSKWASPEEQSLTAPEEPPPPPQLSVTIVSVVEVVSEVKKPSSVGSLSASKWAFPEKATLTAPASQAKKDARIGAKNGGVLGEVVKTNKLGGLAVLKYASLEKKSPEKPAHGSSRGADQPTPSGPRPPPRQSPAPGGSNGGNAEQGRSRVFDENGSPFPSRRRKRGGCGMDGGGDESPSPLRRRSKSRSPSKSPSRSQTNADDGVHGAAGDAFVAPAVVSPARAPLAERSNLHHHRSGAVHIPVAKFGQMILGAAAAPFLPPPAPAMPAAFVPNSSQPLLLQGHAFITGSRGEVRRVRCGVRGSPWHDRATNTVMANIIVGDRIGRETEMVGALHGLPYDLQGNRWHADLFQAVEDLENEEDAAPIGPPRIDPDLEYSSQPVAAVYNWQGGLEEPSLPRFVPGPNDNFGSPPIPIRPSVVPPSYPRPLPKLPQSYIYPVPPPAADNLAHFHPVIDRWQALRAPRETLPGLANSMSGATLVAPAVPPANAERRYTFGTPLVPNFQNHPEYQNPHVQTHDNPNQQLFNHYVVQARQPISLQKEGSHYFTEFPQMQTQDNANQELFNRYVEQAQQPSPAQLSLQYMAEFLGPPLQLTLRRPNVSDDARSPNLPDGPPTPGTIFGNVPNSVCGRPDLAPEDAFDYQPPTPGDLARRSHFEGFDAVFCRLPRANAAIPIVDPNAPSASRPAIRGILKRGREEGESKARRGHEDESKRG